VPQPDGSVDEENISRANRLFGIAGLRLQRSGGWWISSQVRWSDRYDEVALRDAGDGRHLTFRAKGEPAGAMPGFAVWDVLAGWRNPRYSVAAAIENVLDHSYRNVGSSVDGAGINAVLSLGIRL
jgi:hypothetical protein